MENLRKTKVLTASATLLAVVLLGGVAAGALMLSGIYDIAASSPHLAIERSILTFAKRRAVIVHARDVDVPNLSSPDMVRRGLVHYRRYCVTCHGAPGEGPSRTGVGMNPNPPPLVQARTRWSQAEIYWITAKGLKLAGMPAFELAEEPGDLWAIVAFVERMQTLSPREYRRMAAALEGGGKPEQDGPGGAEEIRWLAQDTGWQQLRSRGEPERGKELIRDKGCPACHVIPGVAGTGGQAGPPLARWSKRHYVAGLLVNTPRELARWISDPQGVDPGNAMIDVGVTDAEAWHIAAYLYSLE